MNHHIERVLAVVLFGLCEVVSIAFTIRFTTRLAQGLEPVAIGVVLELAKLTFSFVVVTRYRQRRFVTMGLAATMLTILAVLSAVASTAFFDLTTGDYARNVTVAVDRLDHYGQQIDGLRREQELLTQSAERDLRRNYRWRALQTQEKIADVRERLNEMNDRFGVTADAAPAAALVPSKFETAVTRYRPGIILALAVLLEVIGFVSLQLLCGRNARVSKRVTDGHDENTAVSTEPKPPAINHDVDRVTRLCDDLLRQLQSGRVKPAVRDVRIALGVQQRLAQQALHRLVADGSLVRDGRRFRLPATTVLRDRSG